MGLRERTRQAVQADIAATAMRLFLERGFDATTMEQIATEAGISRRSLFRYFATKEDIVVGDLVEWGRRVRQVLESRPPDEGPWEALRAALESLAHEPSPPQWAARVATMVHETPSLRARRLEKRLQWLDMLVPDIERRLGVAPGSVDDPRAAAIVSSALACLDVAIEAWLRGGATNSIEDLYDVAVAAVRGL
ncbi:TetR family transcriptional regulator [Actinoplanes sp. NPDC051346]|uniref:TetR family transcriptional regulator n=1 Tax=Actinoplanes sp. NPDC051346 TaxID=3155048 RepID=UPI003430F5BD